MSAPLEPRLSVAIVEDEPRTREGLAELIGGSGAFRVAGQYASMEDALPRLLAEPPDLLLSDIGLPGMSGIEGVRTLKARHPGLQALMLTVYSDNDNVFEAVCAGAAGYVLKDTPPEKLLDALRELSQGGAPMTPEIARKVVTMFRAVAPPLHAEHDLTPREVDVLEALASGHSYKTAARALSLSIDTVRFHVRAIYQKLHVHSKSEAVLVALKKGIVR